MPDNGSMMIMCEQCKEWFHKHALVKKYWRTLKDGNTCARTVLTRKMVTIEKRAGIIPYIFPSSIAPPSSFLSCSFYLLDLRTISNVDILEMK